MHTLKKFKIQYTQLGSIVNHESMASFVFPEVINLVYLFVPVTIFSV